MGHAHNEQVRIIGPVRADEGRFFIASTANRVWDGKSWRGFGAAKHYHDHIDAFRAARKASAAL